MKKTTRRTPARSKTPARRKRKSKSSRPWFISVAVIAIALLGSGLWDRPQELMDYAIGLITEEFLGPSGPQLTGVPRVLDGDTLHVQDTRIRMHGIDAPESQQLCTLPRRRDWHCGKDATEALAAKIGNQSVTCHQQDIDRYGRVVATCWVGTTDLNRWMVEEGWAVAYRQYSTDYVSAENRARGAGRGIWASDFVMPWDWRRGDR